MSAGEGGVLVVDDGSRKSGISYTVSENDDPITIKADADHGYHFVEWSDGVTDATRTDNDGESMHDVDVSAVFEKDADSDSTPSSKPKKVDPTPSPLSVAFAPRPRRPRLPLRLRLPPRLRSRKTGACRLRPWAAAR